MRALGRALAAPVLALTILAGFAAVVGQVMGPGPAAAASGPLVKICQATPCLPDLQEFEIFDGYGNPILSVGEFGGLGVFGDLISDTGGPGRVTWKNGHATFWPSMVIGYQSPAAYLAAHPGAITAARCKAPARWDEPGGIWACTAAGRWVLRVRL